MLLCTVFDSISSNIDQDRSINPSANVFLFGDLTSVIMTGLSILVEMIDLACIPDCGSHNPALLDFFLSSDTVICSAMLSLHWEMLTILLS